MCQTICLHNLHTGVVSTIETTVLSSFVDAENIYVPVMKVLNGYIYIFTGKTLQVLLVTGIFYTLFSL